MLAFLLPSVLPSTVLWVVVPVSELITLVCITVYAKRNTSFENTSLNKELISA